MWALPTEEPQRPPPLTSRLHRAIIALEVSAMLNEQGFDLWADGYDRSVGLSEEDGSYPFAGY